MFFLFSFFIIFFFVIIVIYIVNLIKTLRMNIVVFFFVQKHLEKNCKKKLFFFNF